MDDWIRTDELEDVASSIRHALRTATFVREDPQAWKWVMLALHSALQGACVCHLTMSAAPLGAITKRNTREWIAYHDGLSTERPETYLMTLPDLLKAVRKPNSAGDRSNVVGITISDSELECLVEFHEVIRNQLVHFEPMGWSIEISGTHALATLIARIVREITTVGYAFRHFTQAQCDQMQDDLGLLNSGNWLA